MSDDGIVDWGLADRVAGAVVAGVPGRRDPAPTRSYSAAEVAGACSEAIETVSAYAGLGEVARPPIAELIDRRAWARNALGTLAAAAAPIEAGLSADLGLPGLLGGLARRTAGAAIGTEAGVAAGYAARRVLGQYDIAVVGPDRPARLLFVAENLDEARAGLDADPALFLRWVALHETTHVVQFDRVEWLSGHVRGLAEGLIQGAAEGLDAAAVAGILRRLLRDPRVVVRALLAGELSRLLADPERRLQLDRLQATMSVIEGHAEHVMDAAAADAGDDLAELRRRLDERRARRGGLSQLIARLLGMELKLRQYELGKRFCDAVFAEAGHGGLRAMWHSPANLPDLDELERPRGWLDRVAVPA